MAGDNALASGEYSCMGATIRYRRAVGGDKKPGPDRPTVMFLRSEDSLPGDAPFIDALAARYDLIVPDSPGFGASDNPPWFRGMGDMAYFYLDFLAALDLRDVHVIGASIGGWIAAEIAARDCSRIASLSLIAPYGVREHGETYGDVFLWTPDDNIRHRFHDAAMAQTYLGKSHSKEETAGLLKDRYATARLGWAPRFHNPELQRWLHRIAPHTLLLWGENDRIAPPGMAKAWQAGLPHARLHTIAQCGHLPHIERADATRAQIETFIAEARS